MFGVVEQLANSLNAFDTYYEMSDSSRRYDEAQYKKIILERKINYLQSFEKEELLRRLNKVGIFNYKRYFKPQLTCQST